MPGVVGDQPHRRHEQRQAGHQQDRLGPSQQGDLAVLVLGADVQADRRLVDEGKPRRPGRQRLGPLEHVEDMRGPPPANLRRLGLAAHAVHAGGELGVGQQRQLGLIGEVEIRESLVDPLGDQAGARFGVSPHDLGGNSPGRDREPVAARREAELGDGELFLQAVALRVRQDAAHRRLPAGGPAHGELELDRRVERHRLGHGRTVPEPATPSVHAAHGLESRRATTPAVPRGSTWSTARGSARTTRRTRVVGLGAAEQERSGRLVARDGQGRSCTEVGGGGGVQRPGWWRGMAGGGAQRSGGGAG